MWVSIIGIVVMVIVLWWANRGEAAPETAPIIQTNRSEYMNSPGHRFSKESLEYLCDCTALANQHINKYNDWVNAEVYVNFGWEGAATDFDTLNNARWLDENGRGARNGVVLHVMDGDRELEGYERKKALYG